MLLLNLKKICSLAAFARRPSKTMGLRMVLIMISLLLAACRPNAAIRLTPGTPPPTPKESPTPAPTWTPAPRRLDPFIALCLVKTNTRGAPLYTSPDTASEVLRTLKNREVLTVTVRSLDETWIRGQTKDQITGWVQVASAGCTVPIRELYVAKETGTILDVTATAVIAATATALVAGTPSQTPAVTDMPTSAPRTATPTLTLIPATATNAPTATATERPTATPTVVVVPEIQCTVVITKGLNVRIGPSTEFRAFIKLAENEIFEASGRNAEGDWLAGRAPGGRPGWIIVTSVRCASDIEQLAVVPNDFVLQQITPTPSLEQTATSLPAPTETLVPATSTATTLPKLLPTATLTVTLTPIAPTRVATNTVSPAALGLQCTVGVSTGVYLRTGPARTFPSIVVASKGEPYLALARSANNGWLLGRNKNGLVGWSIAGGIRCPAPIRTLPISRQVQPALAPTTAP